MRIEGTIATSAEVAGPVPAGDGEFQAVISLDTDGTYHSIQVTGQRWEVEGMCNLLRELCKTQPTGPRGVRFPRGYGYRYTRDPDCGAGE